MEKVVTRVNSDKEEVKDIVEIFDKEEMINIEGVLDYIKLIQKNMKKIIGEDQQGDYQETKEIFLQEYAKDTRNYIPKDMQWYIDLKKYEVAKNLQNMREYSSFTELFRVVQKKEKSNSLENLTIEPNTEEMLASEKFLRYYIRTNKNATQKGLKKFLTKYLESKEQDIKQKFIQIIDPKIQFLNDYGVIDQDLQTIKESLEKEGLDGDIYLKRTGYERQNYVIGERIGVLDMFSEEYLQKKQVTVDDLMLLDVFWEAKYYTERDYISVALYAIDDLDLWEDVIKGDKSNIEKIDEKTLLDAIKKVAVITRIDNLELEINDKNSRQYKEFISSLHLSEEAKTSTLKKDMKSYKEKEYGINVGDSVKGFFSSRFRVLQQLSKNNVQIDRWGVFEGENGYSTLVAESKNFKGPLIMGIQTDLLDKYVQYIGRPLPVYDKKRIEEDEHKQITSHMLVLDEI